MEFPDTPALWPDKEVTELVNAFRNTFPIQTRLAAQVVTTIVVVIQNEDFQISLKETIFCSRKCARMGLPVLFENNIVQYSSLQFCHCHCHQPDLRPSSRAAFLFSWNGPVFRSEFEKTLDKTEVSPKKTITLLRVIPTMTFKTATLDFMSA